MYVLYAGFGKDPESLEKEDEMKIYYMFFGNGLHLFWI